MAHTWVAVTTTYGAHSGSSNYHLLMLFRPASPTLCLASTEAQAYIISNMVGQPSKTHTGQFLNRSPPSTRGSLYSSHLQHCKLLLVIQDTIPQFLTNSSALNYLVSCFFFLSGSPLQAAGVLYHTWSGLCKCPGISPTPP